MGIAGLMLSLKGPFHLHTLRQTSLISVRCSITCLILIAHFLVQEKGAGAPSGDNPLKPGEKPKPKRGFHTSAGIWADDKKDSDTDAKGNATQCLYGESLLAWVPPTSAILLARYADNRQQVL